MNEFGTSPIASNMTRDTQTKFQTAPPSFGAAWIACFSTCKILKSRFFDLLSLIFGYRYGLKNSEKSLGALLDRINKLGEFQEFSLKPSQVEKNNNEIAKSWNLKRPKNLFLTWYQKSEHEGLFYESLTTRIDGNLSKDRPFLYFCNTVLLRKLPHDFHWALHFPFRLLDCTYLIRNHLNRNEFINELC